MLCDVIARRALAARRHIARDRCGGFARRTAAATRTANADSGRTCRAWGKRDAARDIEAAVAATATEALRSDTGRVLFFRRHLAGHAQRGFRARHHRRRLNRRYHRDRTACRFRRADRSGDTHRAITATTARDSERRLQYCACRAS